jgi:two-component system, NtrC family, sensor histidine kinase HydH
LFQETDEMEVFLLMFVAITVSTTLMISKKREPIHLSFSALCLAITLHKGGILFQPFLSPGVSLMMELVGLLAIPPLTINFTLSFFKGQTLIKRRDVRTTALLSVTFAALVFTPAIEWTYAKTFVYIYAGCVLIICYFSLVDYLRKKASREERKLLVYLVGAFTVMIASFSIAPLFNLIASGALYFILMMLTRPHVTELQDFMTRAFVTLTITLFTSVFFYLVIGFFGNGIYLSFTLVFMVSFLIIIAIGPFQILLKRMLTSVYPEIKDIFTSPFDLDEKLEREKSLLLEKMAPVFAHEIRNPLGSIKGAAQVLRTEIDQENHRRLLDVITEETNRLNSVVSQFLDYARPTKIEMQPAAVNTVIEKAMALIETDRVAEHVHIRLELHPHLPPALMDRQQIHQIILNIALNAIEAMPEGGTLTVRTTKIEGADGDAVGISIRDTGQGMQRDVVRQIFKPFFTTKERGVGLGLSVCRRIIADHGGKIRVKSLPKQGTIFYIRLQTIHPFP